MTDRLMVIALYKSTFTYLLTDRNNRRQIEETHAHCKRNKKIAFENFLANAADKVY